MSKKQLLLLSLSLGFSLKAPTENSASQADENTEQVSTDTQNKESGLIASAKNNPKIAIGAASVVLGAGVAAVDCLFNSSDDEKDESDAASRAMVVGLASAGTAAVAGLGVNKFLNADVSGLEKEKKELVSKNEKLASELAAKLEKAEGNSGIGLDANSAIDIIKKRLVSLEKEKDAVEHAIGLNNVADVINSNLEKIKRLEALKAQGAKKCNSLDVTHDSGVGRTIVIVDAIAELKVENEKLKPFAGKSSQSLDKSLGKVQAEIQKLVSEIDNRLMPRIESPHDKSAKFGEGDDGEGDDGEEDDGER